MTDLVYAWLTPQGVIALGVVIGLVQGAITRRNVTKIEVATNSMKDALVEATARASHAEGKAEGVAQQEAKGKD